MTGQYRYVTLMRVQQVRQQDNTYHVLVHTAVGHQIRATTFRISTRPPLAGGPTVLINHSGSQFSVPLHALQSMQAGKFFCQFFGVFFAKIRQMAKCCAKFSR